MLWPTEQTSRCGDKWKDFQSAVRTVAEEKLQGRPQANKVWLQQDTLELAEKKRLAFAHWQEYRLDQTQRQEYNLLAIEVKRRGKTEWWNDLMTDMKEDLNRD